MVKSIIRIGCGVFILIISFFVTLNCVAGEVGLGFEVGVISDAEQVGKRMRSRQPQLDNLPTTFLNESGIRQLKGKYITLFTDVKSGAEVDRLPYIFDLMVLGLCEYFGVKPVNYEEFRVRVFLIDDLGKFSKHNVLRGAADLRFGYSLQNQIWVRHQKDDYYQRHLFLHEGVHAFMFYAFGTFPPFWYREGIAEMLATHKFENGKLKLGWFPNDTKSVLGLGRVETIQRLIERLDNKSDKNTVDISGLDYLFSLGESVQGVDQVDLYSVCWGLVMFCDNHPRYRAAFRRLVFRLSESRVDFRERLIALIASESKTDLLTTRFRFEADWNDFKKNICYGYDFERAIIDFQAPPINVTKNNKDIVIRVDRGWQNSGLVLEVGKRYKLTATGRFQVADKPDIWWSEPNGITIRYNQKMPIGKLQAMILPDAVSPTAKIPTPEYKEIGENITWQPAKKGSLFLKINDPASSLADNKGTLTLTIQELPNIP
ncbi:MAG: DUF1570 domain-containing protein [Planctomycetaceae bacterium]|jgi:hypothetical protein|nr:DUF1570 domain-containing protein [Planctomycetaceae bacterium]